MTWLRSGRLTCPVGAGFRAVTTPLLYPWPITSVLPRHLFTDCLRSLSFWLRCADNDDMIVPRTRTARYGPRSFRVAAPQIWNMLPPHLKNIRPNVSHEQFKSGLKTWLFVQA